MRGDADEDMQEVAEAEETKKELDAIKDFFKMQKKGSKGVTVQKTAETGKKR